MDNVGATGRIGFWGIEGTLRRWFKGGGDPGKYRSKKFIDIPLQWADADRHCVSK